MKGGAKTVCCGHKKSHGGTPPHGYNPIARGKEPLLKLNNCPTTITGAAHLENGNTGSAGIAPGSGSSLHRIDEVVHFRGQTGNLAGSVIPMKCSLGSGTVDNRNRFLKGLLCSFHRLSGDSFADLLHHALDAGFVHSVTQPCQLALLISL